MACNLGLVWRTVDGIYLAEMRFPAAGAVAHQHVHEFGHNTLLVAGSVRLTINGDAANPTLMKAPCLIFIEAGKEHEFEALEDGTLAYCFHNLNGLPMPSVLRPHGE